MRRMLSAPAAPSSTSYYFTHVCHSRVDVLWNLSLRALSQPEELRRRLESRHQVPCAAILTLTAILKPACRQLVFALEIFKAALMKFASTHSSVNQYGALVAFGNGKNYDTKSKKSPNNTAQALLPTTHRLLHGS